MLEKNFMLWKREREYQGSGEEYLQREKKLEGNQYHLPFDIKAVGKNIKWGSGNGYWQFSEENKDLNKRVGEFLSCREFYTPLEILSLAWDFPVVGDFLCPSFEGSSHLSDYFNVQFIYQSWLTPKAEDIYWAKEWRARPPGDCVPKMDL